MAEASTAPEAKISTSRRDRLIEKLASLPPVPGALDQIVVVE